MRAWNSRGLLNLCAWKAQRENDFPSPCSTRESIWSVADKAPFFHDDPSWHRCLACLPGQQITSHFRIRVGACSTVSDSLLSHLSHSLYLPLLLFPTLPFSSSSSTSFFLSLSLPSSSCSSSRFEYISVTKERVSGRAKGMKTVTDQGWGTI